ncbi:hypothetical protein [Mucilaginibacter paludis]|uniref:Uncharacterized protein n=1 Tax=Mucilaginibacter paludis DSM 18603 TaxID=714943 RepID=H1Y9S1_9SPHI|nr:hypothetical protein [Mucilaginibacter paludis]EHQ31104.1 hypothetical protein Mucpa_7061 [Mucilaginibacter paludis DSM 18603]
MTTNPNMSWVYDTMFSIPGMNEAVKIDLKLNRKTILLLDSVIGIGLSNKEGESAPGLTEMIPKEMQDELRAFSEECLSKAGLTELSIKLKNFPGK